MGVQGKHVLLVGPRDAVVAALGLIDCESTYKDMQTDIAVVVPGQRGNTVADLSTVEGNDVASLLKGRPAAVASTIEYDIFRTTATLPANIVAVALRTEAQKLREEGANSEVRRRLCKAAGAVVLCFEGPPSADQASRAWRAAGKPRRAFLFNVFEPSYDESGKMVGGKRSRAMMECPTASQLLGVTGSLGPEYLPAYRAMLETAEAYDAATVNALCITLKSSMAELG